MCTGFKGWKGTVAGTGLGGMLPDYDNRPPTVTGKQTGVANPKDTAAATESLRLQRKRNKHPLEEFMDAMDKGGLG